MLLSLSLYIYIYIYMQCLTKTTESQYFDIVHLVFYFMVK